MTQTTQKLSNLEKAKYLIALKEKAQKDIILYYHYESIRQELLEDVVYN